MLYPKKIQISIKSVFGVLWKTSTDFSVYLKLNKKPIQSIIGYLFFLLLYVGVVLGVIVATSSFFMIGKIYDDIVEQIPVLKLNSGVLSTQGSHNFTFVEDLRGFAVMIDTDASIESEQSFNEYSGFLLFAKDGWIVNSGSGEIQKTKYRASIRDFQIDSQYLKDMKYWFLFLISVFVPFVFVVLQFFSFLFYAAFFGIAFLLLAWVSRTEYSSKDLFKICLLVNGPALFYSLIIRILGISFPMLYSIVYAVFLTGALSQLNKQTKKSIKV